MDLFFFFYLCFFFDKLFRLLLAAFVSTAGKGRHFCSLACDDFCVLSISLWGRRSGMLFDCIDS